MPQHPSLSEQVAGFVIDASDLPEQVMHESVRAFVNWLGCSLGGADHEAVTRAIRACTEFSGPAVSTLLGHSAKLDPASAAFVNCLASSIYSYDDTHLSTITHPTGPVAAVLFALAETHPISGEEFVKALALGIEIECRLSNALLAPPAKAKLGWYVTGLTGGMAAALAGGRVLGLSFEQMIWAMGIAASQASGTRQTHGSMSIGLVPAHAARCALMAIRMAQQGFTCSPDPLHGKNGFLEVFAEAANPDALTDGLGVNWEMRTNTYKPYPGGIVIHPAVDACLEITGNHNFSADDIDRVIVDVSPAGFVLCNRPMPADTYAAGVSLQHWMAASLVRKKAGIAECSAACVHDPAIVQIRNMIEVEASDDVERDAAKVTVSLKDGQTLKARIDHCRGSLENPMSDDDLSQKFLGQSGILPRTKAEELLGESWNLRRLAAVSQLADAARL